MATDYSKLKVVDLKAQLKRRGLPQAGRKDELIARLEEADAAPEEPQSTEETVSQTAQASEPSPAEEPAVDEPADDDDDRQTGEGEDAEGAIHQHIPTDEASTPKASAQVAEPSAPSQTPSQAPSASAEPESTPVALPAASSSELLQDSQKRKRRSASPPPSGHETPRKRARVSGESVAEEPETSLPAKLGEAEDAKISALNGVGGRQETTAEPDEPLDYGASSPVEQEQDQEAREATPTPASHAAATGARDREPSPEGPRSSTAMEVERDVEPAIHPATSALYIKNFMRPLHKPVVEQYLVDLANPAAAAAAADPDPDVVVDFFLDTIRTHAFVRFANVAAASRVRTALHGVVWPDERNRKPLWVDFVPPDEIAGWVDREQQGAAGSRSLNRWEVVYETDDGGRGGRGVVAVLREAGVDLPSNTKNSRAGARPPTGPAAAAASSGKVDIPTGPSSRVYPGIEAAPSGPRGYLDRSRAPGPPPSSSSSSGRQAGPGGPEQTTRALPPISYQPVSAEVAKRRVAHVHSFVPRDPQRRALVGRDKNRYTFEMGDRFVDRGPEMFEGIRPPHRERERRAAGGAAFGGGGGGRQGGGARGFGRGPGSSRYDDYRPPPRRYEQYRGGGGRDDYRDRRY